jgi:EpsD family peptidyl-prolyl cis-trans isomerase
MTKEDRFGMKWIRILLPLLALSLVLAGGCSKKDEDAKVDAPEAPMAARIGDWSISKEFLEDFLRKMPESQRQKYDSPEGRAILADKLMQEELAYLEAQTLDLTQRENVAKQIQEATRSILVTEYLSEFVDSKARPSDEEIHDYYESHQDQYTELETLRAQHIFAKDKEKLDELKARIEEGGEKLTTLAQKYSEDQITKADGGDLGYFNPGGYIRGVGYSKEFTDAVMQMEPGKLYVIKWEKGYSLVRINEKEPAKLRPFDEVREEIATRLARDKIEIVRAQHFSEVQRKYDTRNFMRESYEKMQRGPEELFNYAQNSSDPLQRIEAFQQIIDKYPQDEYAPQAMFMIGFVYAEELQDMVRAEKTFSDLILTYPESQMAESAKWMKENLEKPLPKFEDLDDLNRQIEEKSQ